MKNTKRKKTGNSKRNSEFWNPQWIATIIAAVIVGYMTYLGSVEPVRLEIQATQTAEARLLSSPTIDTTATSLSQDLVSTQQAFATSIRLTEQSIMATATAVMSNVLTPTPISTLPPTNVPVATVNDVPPFFIYFFSIFWAIIALANKTGRNNLVNRIITLISKPIILKVDEGTPVPGYPRQPLEQTAQALTNVFEFHNLDKIIDGLTNNTKQIAQSSLRNYIGDLVKLGMFLCFVWADAISVTNTLGTLSLISGDVPSFLTRYEIAVIFGSLLSLIVGVWVIVESKEASNNRSDPAHKIIVGFSCFLVTSGLLATLIFALARYSALGLLPNDFQKIAENTNNVVLVILIPVNNVIASFVIFTEALKGLAAVSLLLISISLTGLYLLRFIYKFIFWVIIFLFDMIYRIILIYMFIASFLLLTPFDSIFRTNFSSFKKDV